MGFLGDFGQEETKRIEAAHQREEERRRIALRYGEAWGVLDLAQVTLQTSLEAGTSEAQHKIPLSHPNFYDVTITSPWMDIVDNEVGLLTLRLVRTHQHHRGYSGRYVRDELDLEAQSLHAGGARQLGGITRSRGGFIDYGVYVSRQRAMNRIEPESAEAQLLFGLCRRVLAELRAS